MNKKCLEEHEHVHSGKIFPCPSQGCMQKYTTNAALNAHMIVHEEKEFKCDACPKTFNTKPNFNSIFKESMVRAGGPFVGKSMWPKKMHNHEKLCKTCTKLDQKEKDHLAKIRTKLILKRQG